MAYAGPVKLSGPIAGMTIMCSVAVVQPKPVLQRHNYAAILDGQWDDFPVEPKSVAPARGMTHSSESHNVLPVVNVIPPPALSTPKPILPRKSFEAILDRDWKTPEHPRVPQNIAPTVAPMVSTATYLSSSFERSECGQTHDFHLGTILSPIWVDGPRVGLGHKSMPARANWPALSNLSAFTVKGAPTPKASKSWPQPTPSRSASHEPGALESRTQHSSDTPSRHTNSNASQGTSEESTESEKSLPTTPLESLQHDPPVIALPLVELHELYVADEQRDRWTLPVDKRGDYRLRTLTPDRRGLHTPFVEPAFASPS